MAVLTTRIIAQAGSAPNPLAAAAGGDRVECGKTVFLRAVNASAGALTVTIDSVVPCNYGTDHDISVSVPAGATRDIGPLPPERFAALTDGLAAVTYPGGVTSLTVEAVKL